MLIAQLNAVEPKNLADILIVTVVLTSLALAARAALRRSENRREMREDRAALTRQMLEEIGRVHASVNESEQRLGQNLRTLPGEIMALLRNAGVIHPRE
jgi:hypothetical protein